MALRQNRKNAAQCTVSIGKHAYTNKYNNTKSPTIQVVHRKKQQKTQNISKKKQTKTNISGAQCIKHTHIRVQGRGEIALRMTSEILYAFLFAPSKLNRSDSERVTASQWIVKWVKCFKCTNSPHTLDPWARLLRCVLPQLSFRSLAEFNECVAVLRWLRWLRWVHIISVCWVSGIHTRNTYVYMLEEARRWSVGAMRWHAIRMVVNGFVQVFKCIITVSGLCL